MDEHTLAVLTHPVRTQALWKRVRILRCDGERIATVTDLETPVPAADLTGFADRLVICGQTEAGPRLFELESTTSGQWLPLSIPRPLQGFRKGMDALATDGRRLVAVDNTILPKWMVRYLPTKTGRIRSAGAAQMFVHGTYEHVIRAHSGTSLFLVFSTTVGRAGAFGHLALYRFSDLTHAGSLDFPSAPVACGMQGDTAWLLHPDHPDRLLRFSPDTIGSHRCSLEHLLKTNDHLPLHSPCRTLIRSRNGRLFAVPREDGKSLISVADHQGYQPHDPT